jgi:glyoxylase I family protein
MILKLHHTGMSVTDLDRSIAFYRDLLGMKLLWRLEHRRGPALEKVLGLTEVEVSYAMLESGIGRLELFQYHSPQGKPNPLERPVCDRGITHVAFQVQGIQDLYERLKEKGVRFHSEPQLVREGVTVAYMRDPEGIVVELVQYEEGLG